MSHFFRITKDKIKLFFFFLFITFLFSILAIFPLAIIARRAGPDGFQEQMNIFNKFFGILSSCIIPYLLLIFLKKEFFLKKYFTEFTKIFFIVFISRELVATIPILFYKNFSEFILSNSIQSNIIQVMGIILELFIFYIAVCFIDQIDKESVQK